MLGALTERYDLISRLKNELTQYCCSRKITEEEHRCQAEEETEEFETACAGPGTNTCKDIVIGGKEYNLCCCNDKPW